MRTLGFLLSLSSLGRCLTDFLFWLSLSFLDVIFSIQNWALEEAKARMEARGEKAEYKPS